MRHPEHDRLAEAVRSSYRASFPKIGIQVERRRFGFYTLNLNQPDRGRIIACGLTADAVPEFLADARRYFSSRVIDIWLEDRDADLTLGPVLIAAGCTRPHQTTTAYLAHAGPIPRNSPSSRATIEIVSDALVPEFAVVKLKAFAGSEDEPSAEEVRKEVTVRRGELEGDGRLLISRVGREGAAILAYYDGNDRLIFQLATRRPFRGRGIARDLLCHVLMEAYHRGCRSVLINTDPDDTPMQWYRRLGFTDEVYWHSRYIFQ